MTVGAKCVDTTLRAKKGSSQMDRLSRAVLVFGDPLHSDTASGASGSSSSKYRLFQLNDALTGALKVGDTLYVKGSDTEDAVLCSDTATYGLVRAETSNTLLLLNLSQDTGATARASEEDDERPCVFIQSMMGSHIEVFPTAPRLTKLKTLLLETALAEDDDWSTETTAEPDTAAAAPMSDSDDDVIVLPSYPTPSQAARACKTGSGSGPSKTHRGYTFTELLTRVQCSREELFKGLVGLSAIAIHGRFRILHPTFEEAIIAFIIGVLFETNGDPSAVPVAEYTDMLSLYPAPLVVHCLLSLSASDEALQAVKAAAEAREYTVPAVIALDVKKVSKLCGLITISKHPGSVVVDAFLEEWRGKLPDTVPVDLSLLEGNVLCETSSRGVAMVKYFPEKALSPEPSKRFAQLFDAREGWKLEDIKPFLMPLVGSVSLDELMLGHTRSTLCPDGSRLFSKR